MTTGRAGTAGTMTTGRAGAAGTMTIGRAGPAGTTITGNTTAGGTAGEAVGAGGGAMIPATANASRQGTPIATTRTPILRRIGRSGRTSIGRGGMAVSTAQESAVVSAMRAGAGTGSASSSAAGAATGRATFNQAAAASRKSGSTGGALIQVGGKGLASPSGFATESRISALSCIKPKIPGRNRQDKAIVPRRYLHLQA